MQLGLIDRVIFAGVRPDVPHLMRGVMDVFLFPSLHEGLGLVLIKAQAAGLPCIFSNVVPEEVDVFKPLMRRISLARSAFVWAEAVMARREATSAIKQLETVALIERSPFNIQTGIANLEKIYTWGMS